jgi:hypothetical protein
MGAGDLMKRMILATAFLWAMVSHASAQQVHGDLSGFMPGPTVVKLNGQTPGGTCPSHQWASSLSTSAVPTCTQPAATDVSGLGSLATQSSVAGTLIGVQIFTTSSTYTPDTGTNSVIVEGCGGGGSGGGAAASSATNNASLGSGGGAGGYFKVRLTSGFSSATVTIGSGGAAPSAGNNNGNAGGNTSFGSAVTGDGGSGGLSLGTGTGRADIGGTGGSVTVSSGTQIAATQGYDGGNLFFSSSVGWSGKGGDSTFGKGGQSIADTNSGSTQAAGNAGQGYCSGGSGGISTTNASGTPQQGGAGANGILIVWELS